MAKRRGDNEGSIYQTQDGNWRGQVSVNGRRLSYTGKTRKAVQEWLKAAIKQIDGGMTYMGATMKVAAYMKAWLKVIKQNRRPKTYYQYEATAVKYILPKYGNTSLKDLRPGQFESYLADLKNTGVGERTVQIVYAIFHSCLSSAMKKGLIGRNPLDAIEKPKVRNPRRKVVLSLEQAQQFLIAAEGSKMSVLYHLALATGMREGELLGLKWSDIDWRKNTLRVERQVQRVPGQGLVFAPPKTDAGNRIIALGPSTMSKLSDHRVQQEQFRLVVGDTWIDNGLIFPSSIGTPFDPRNLLKDFKIVLGRAGLPDMRFHDVRHSSITLLLNEVGAPIKEAQHRAGHTRPSTTMDIYGGEVSSKLDSAMAEGLDELITPVQVILERKKEVDAGKSKGITE